MLREKQSNNQKNKFKILPRGMINLYGLLAILLVIIPEWIAEMLIMISNANTKRKLPKLNEAWREQPDLILAKMNIRELRQLASQLKLNGYSNQNRKNLYSRLLKELKKNNTKS